MATKKNIKIKLESGEVMAITLVSFNPTKPKAILEKHSGLLFGKGNYIYQAIGMLNAWACHNTPDNPDTLYILKSAIAMILYGYSEMTGGYMALNSEQDELVVYVPHPSQHYIIRIKDRFGDMMVSNNWDMEPGIIKVKTIGSGTKLTTDELHEQLKKALENEEYELASKLRDKINKKRIK